MDCPRNKFNTISYDAHFDFGNYTAATSKLKVEYTYEGSPSILRERALEINNAKN